MTCGILTRKCPDYTRMKHRVPDRIISKLTTATELVRHSGAGGGSVKPDRSKMTAQDVGLIALALVRLPADNYTALSTPPAGGGNRTVLLSQVFKSAALISARSWDCQVSLSLGLAPSCNSMGSCSGGTCAEGCLGMYARDVWARLSDPFHHIVCPALIFVFDFLRMRTNRHWPIRWRRTRNSGMRAGARF